MGEMKDYGARRSRIVVGRDKILWSEEIKGCGGRRSGLWWEEMKDYGVRISRIMVGRDEGL